MSRFPLGGLSCGGTYDQQHRIRPVEDGVAYTQVEAGGIHTVLPRSDGSAVACGGNNDGQCDIPPLEEGLSYLQVFAGRFHTVLLRSDGFAVACGDSGDEQCRISSLSSWLEWLSGAPPRLRYTCDKPAPQIEFYRLMLQQRTRMWS